MDTAQRGMGLDWPAALELIRHTLGEAKHRPGAVVGCGAGTDHLEPGKARTVDDVISAYEMQFEAIEALGGRIILMASRALAAIAKGPDDYHRVYDRLLRQVRQPVVIHWLGEMFDPALAGYWGSSDPLRAMETALAVIAGNAAKVDGVKISLLSKEKEILMRRRLPAGVRMYTGDDFNYAELIEGDEHGYSDALLGIFDAIAPAASLALGRLAAGDNAGFDELLAPTVPLSRHIFTAPTRFYKTGVVFLAYLNGLQNHFHMIGGPAKRTLPAASRGVVSSRRCRTCVAQSGAGGRAHRHRDGPGRHRKRGMSVPGLSLNLATVRPQFGFAAAVDACLAQGITAIAPWRDQVEAIGLAEAAKIVELNGLQGHGSLPGRHVSGHGSGRVERRHRGQQASHR